MRVLLDTNIILDFFLEREPFFLEVNELFKAISSGRIEGFVTASSATDIFYICKRQTKSLTESRIILTAALKLLSVCSVNRQILEVALQSGLPDFEDAVQIACAIEQELDAIATRNSQDFATNEIPVLTIHQVLDRLKYK